MKERPIDYKIKCSTPTDFELSIKVEAKSRTIKRILLLTSRKYKQLQNKDYTEVKNFVVPKEYHSYLKIATKRLVNIPANIFKKDGIEIMDYKVTGALYQLDKNTKSWFITIFYGGIYADKRKESNRIYKEE